jgi:putative nucleotidyltransferase with HDIG domain
MRTPNLSHSQREMMSMPTLKNSNLIRIDRNFEMPSVPIVLSKILQMVDDNRASSRQLEELIIHDPSLTARILKLANSALYSFRSEVKTISHAITLLGLNLVKSLAIGVSIFESFTKGLRQEVGCINQLWMHSFGVGVMAQEIWIKRSSRSEAEFALLCGLLHDLGKVAYFKKDAIGYAKLFSMEKGEDAPDLSSLENEKYGVDHATLGSQIAKHWGLPPELATVVRQHHSELSGLPLVAAVSMADMLVKQAGIGYDGDRKVTADVTSLQELLKMDPAEFETITSLAISKRADVEEFFHYTL